MARKMCSNYFVKKRQIKLTMNMWYEIITQHNKTGKHAFISFYGSKLFVVSVVKYTRNGKKTNKQFK